tara:strand:+ start:525 stop:908 length:384 start_codon:yes stop_codon:yes gene_type:complete
MSLTQLYAQTGKDSLQCYTFEELQKIANKVVRANQCDTLLITCEEQLALKDSANIALHNVINAKDLIIIEMNKTAYFRSLIISGQSTEIEGLRKLIKKEKSKKSWLKAGWISTTVFLTGILTYFIIN